jgi:prepilin-type processing-associated H-X9-DG protein
VVVILVLSLLVLVLLMSLPRRREVARGTSCQLNLMRIGVALALYDQEAQHLPIVPEPGSEEAKRVSSPLKTLLETLGLPDLRGLENPKRPPNRESGRTVEVGPVPGFVCPSDPNATGGGFPAPVSYRATAGDAPDGHNGGFAPGRVLRLADIEAGDGKGYTAAFAERFAGNRRPVPAVSNYAEVPAPINAAGCPEALNPWRGDAGASWVVADWQSTLYNHALTPNAAPSCIASDGRTALMGSSSGHTHGVNVLLFDGSVKVYTPRVDPKIWRDLATPNPPVAPSREPR